MNWNDQYDSDAETTADYERQLGLSRDATENAEDGLDSEIEEEIYSHIYFTHQEAVKTSKKTEKAELKPVKPKAREPKKPAVVKEVKSKPAVVERKETEDDEDEPSKSKLFNKTTKTETNSEIKDENGDAGELSDSEDDSDDVVQRTKRKMDESSGREDEPDAPFGSSFSPILAFGGASDENGSDHESDEDDEKYAIRSLGEKRAESEDTPGLLSEATGGRKPSRYYTEKAGKCHNCKQTGHFAKDCTAPMEERPCYVCAKVGHRSSECPSEYCFNCLELGHHSKNCRKPRKYRYSLYCRDCRSKGHNESKCPLLWRVYSGDENGSRSKKDIVDVVSCYNCASTTHFGDDCPTLEIRGMAPQSPFRGASRPHKRPHTASRAFERPNMASRASEQPHMASRASEQPHVSQATSRRGSSEPTVKDQRQEKRDLKKAQAKEKKREKMKEEKGKKERKKKRKETETERKRKRSEGEEESESKPKKRKKAGNYKAHGNA